MDNEFEQILGDTGDQESLVCSSPRGSQKVGQDWMTEQQKGMKNSWVCLWWCSHCPNKVCNIPGYLTPIQVPTSQINSVTPTQPLNPFNDHYSDPIFHVSPKSFTFWSRTHSPPVEIARILSSFSKSDSHEPLWKILALEFISQVEAESSHSLSSSNLQLYTLCSVASTKPLLSQIHPLPPRHLLLLYRLCQSHWLCRSQQTVENSSIGGNTRPSDLPPEKPVCRWGSNS